jgi:hypothetical protein
MLSNDQAGYLVKFELGQASQKLAPSCVPAPGDPQDQVGLLPAPLAAEADCLLVRGWLLHLHQFHLPFSASLATALQALDSQVPGQPLTEHQARQTASSGLTILHLRLSPLPPCLASQHLERHLQIKSHKMMFRELLLSESSCSSNNRLLAETSANSRLANKYCS